MKKVINFLKWLFKIWPVMLPIAVGVVHYNIYWYSPYDFSDINKYVGLFLQILGCIIVVFNINSNLGVFNEHGLAKKFISYLKSCPLKQNNNILTPMGIVMGSPIVGSVGIYQPKKYTNIEDRVNDLEIKINELNDKLLSTKKEVTSLVLTIRGDIEKELGNIKSELLVIKNDVKETLVGGLDIQLFGIGIAIYGSSISIW